ncbi:MAG: 30S ribosomal protein S5 [Candidatus Saganbacteria bacterium]|nr:30S ribosomal protein S5 [Candidatus Saganbacteria bacterium]
MGKFNRPREPKEFEERVVQVRRVCKVVSGGKRLGFRVLAIVGDKKGRVGIGLARASEVVASIRKSMEDAKKNLVTIPMIGGTIAHRVQGDLGASSVIIRPAPPGTGVIAGGSVRIVLELLGIRDAVAKSVGSANAVNVAKATVEALLNIQEQEKIEALRGKKIKVKYVQEPSNA